MISIIQYNISCQISSIFRTASQNLQNRIIFYSRNLVDFCCCFMSFKKAIMKTQNKIWCLFMKNWQSWLKIFISIWKSLIMFLNVASWNFNVKTKLIWLFCFFKWKKTTSITYTFVKARYLFLYKSKILIKTTKNQKQISFFSRKIKNFWSKT